MKPRTSMTAKLRSGARSFRNLSLKKLSLATVVTFAAAQAIAASPTPNASAVPTGALPMTVKVISGSEMLLVVIDQSYGQSAPPVAANDGLDSAAAESEAWNVQLKQAVGI